MIHLVFPIRSNQYHPHSIRPLGFTLVIGLAVGMYMLGMITAVDSSVKGVDTVTLSPGTLLQTMNEARRQSHKPAVLHSALLEKAAEMKAHDMTQRHYWSHNAPDGTTPWHWIQKVGYKYEYAGENLAKGFSAPNTVTTAWLNSKEHRRNVLNEKYTEVGFGISKGVIEGRQTTIIVALYASPLGSVAVTSTPTYGVTDTNGMSLAAHFGTSLKSMNPTMLGSLFTLGCLSLIAFAAFALRGRLPKSAKQSWHRHHALYKGLITVCLVVALISLYGGAQIL